MADFTIERPHLKDVDRMKKILDVFAAKGELLARSRMDFYEKIRDFYVARIDGEIVGVCALHVLWEDLAEVRSLAVSEDAQKGGIGSKLVEKCMDDARELGIEKVFTLTYRPGFFERNGFAEVDKSQLPHKVWKACLDCVHFPDCNEIAMIRKVT